ncbi:hypothetical protein Aab01nite_11620 [Paractinoplanes abujensis]|uniref:histidine kinase n=1 Tax=Paractinoplanes abujensis TaxID=882441 RepID=A0A7W7G0C8_9ACTN|nr:histidine kinase [Actinoplanes abujensis]MBB4691015.1 signal transduction histidine kinase [Actinoplanes abujensis]GID17572.1 hypothetical protein Aab01nite_11620 [Actinoplanes abujensis]
MARWKVWLLPALAAVAQLAYWPGLAFSVRAVTGIAVVAVVTAGLCLRRWRPVVAAAVVTGGLGLGAWALPQQVYFSPGDALLLISAAESIALFNVALRCSRRTTVLVVLGMLAVQVALLVGDEPLDLLLAPPLYALVAALGRVRRRWHEDRSAAAHRLAEAEEARRDAAAAEQRRLARELHDVTAHHLTSIVVNATAAQFVGRPELTAEALTFAARTGRETLVALHQLVSVLPAPPGTTTLADLTDDFRQLGQVVRLTRTGSPPPAQAEALHGIAREALTNTLRYAPGATVEVSQTYDGTGATLVVADDGPGVASDAAKGLGGGRGLSGMRDRAAAFGGTVTAGPRESGGWEVRATLPAGAAPARLRVWLRSQVVLDAGLLLLALVLPLTGVVLLVEEDGVAPAAAVLTLLAVVAHAVPLLWRRTRPWTALIAVALTGWLAPLLVVTAVLPPAEAWIFLFSTGADLAAVYAVAAYGKKPASTWIGLVGALFSAALVLAALLVTDDEVGVGKVAFFLFTAVFGWFALALPYAGSWIAGYATRRRRERRLAVEESAVAVVSAEALLRARDERARVAAGLHATVLTAAARVPQAAEQNDLDGVIVAARESLAAMRGLLDGLRPAQEVSSSPSV